MSELRALHDHELAVMVRNSDKGAYTEIYQRYFRLLFIHARKKLPDDDAAKDVVQDLFTIIWLRRETLMPPSTSLAAYLFGAVRNRILDIYSHQQVQQKYVNSLQQFLDTATADPETTLREKELLEHIENEINALPPKMREVFELSRKASLSHREIAEQLHISEQTVAKQVSNALKILRSKLGCSAFILVVEQFISVTKK